MSWVTVHSDNASVFRLSARKYLIWRRAQEFLFLSSTLVEIALGVKRKDHHLKEVLKGI